MIRWGLWISAGLVLGAIVHLLTILWLPTVATQNAWARINELDALGKMVVFDDIAPGAANPLSLDPEIVYATCQFDLSEGPGVLSGPLTEDFWSIGVFDSSGVAVYSTTNRSGVGQSLEMGIFNAAQTRLLAEQQFEIQEGLLIVESPVNDVFVIVRLAPPHRAMRARYREILAGLRCGHIDDPAVTSGRRAQG